MIKQYCDGLSGSEFTHAVSPHAAHRRRWRALAVCLALLVVLAFAGCAGGQSGDGSGTPPSTASHGATPGAGAQSATPAGPGYVQITDLNAFRQQLSSAFSSNTWSKLLPFLSPAFSFQGLNSGGNRMVMPDSAVDFSQLYKSGGPWSQSSQYEVNIHYCYAGNTPANQQMGFDGGGGSFILVGIERWQGVWLIAWAFQDPNGGQDGCAAPG